MRTAVFAKMMSRMTFSGFVRTKVVSCRSGNQPWPMRVSLDDEYVSLALLVGLWNNIGRFLGCLKGFFGGLGFKKNRSKNNAKRIYSKKFSS